MLQLVCSISNAFFTSKWREEVVLDYEEFYFCIYGAGARGGIVVKALRYKPAGRGFDSRWCQDFSP